MMEANFRDSKLFSKLVNQKRKTSQGYTAMIKIDDTEYRGDAQVLSGFFEYHNGNSSPLSCPNLEITQGSDIPDVLGTVTESKQPGVEF